MASAKVSFIVQGVDGGIVTVASALAARLPQHGIEPQLIFIGSGTPASVTRAAGYASSVHALSATDLLSRSVGHLLSIQAIAAEIDAFNPDLVVAAGVLSALVYSLGSAAGKRNAILWDQGPQTSYTWLKRTLLRRAARHFRGVASSSRGSQAVFRNTFPFPFPNYWILENGVDFARFHGSRHPLRLDRRIDIIMPARIDGVQKDHLSLLRGFALFKADHPAARLTIVGSGPGARGIAGEVDCLGLRDSVTLRPHTDHIEKLLGAHNVVCLSTRWEGLPLSLIEGMAAGLLVCGSEVTGVTDIVTDGVTGFLFAPESPAAIARCFRRIAEKPLEAEAVAVNGSRVAERRWTSEIVARNAADLLLGQLTEERKCELSIA
jgi:glycosyltransferase involved in cell wall biosynthesis